MMGCIVAVVGPAVGGGPAAGAEHGRNAGVEQLEPVQHGRNARGEQLVPVGNRWIHLQGAKCLYWISCVVAIEAC